MLVIGRAGRRIPAARWAEHVLGYTVGNEGTIRDWVRHGKFNVTPGKNWAHSGAIGPWITTADAVPSGPMRVVTCVNDEVRQDDTTERLMFPFGRIVEYISTFCTLEPGDVIFTGTPNGAGARFDPPRYLRPGDVVTVEVPGIGLLRNTVMDEVRAIPDITSDKLRDRAAHPGLLTPVSGPLHVVLGPNHGREPSRSRRRETGLGSARS